MVLSNETMNTDKVSSMDTELKPIRLDDIQLQPEVEFKNTSVLDDELVTTNQAKAKESWFKRTFCCKGEKKKKSMVPFFKLFKFADKTDYIMMGVGIFGALGNGASLPLMIYIFTNMIGDFSMSARICPNTTTANVSQSIEVYGTLLDKMKMQAVYMIVLGFGTMILMYLQVTYWIMPAERQSRLIRKSLFVSIVRQDIGWFDVNKSEELNNRLTEDVNKIKDGLGDKLGNGVQYLATFIIAVIISLVRGWKLTLVILSISPIIFISAVLFTQLTSVLTSQELKSYARAGAVAEEVLTAIRTVFAYNGAHREHKRYEKRLDDAKSYGIKKGFINGGMMGLLFLVINSAYALGFWYGWTLTEELDPVTGQPKFTVGEILLVFFNIIIGVFSLGNAGPLIGTIASARAAAYEIYNIIDRVPPIDTLSAETGAKPTELIGNIEFENVSFCYPARKEAKILNGISYTIKTGQKVALVGDSGCGKSTCVQLIQRFYDPDSGVVKLDNQNLKDLNLKWLREQIGVVNQEPVLFGISIKENILMGNESATDEELVAAAKSANAHDFIMKLPDKYDTLVGDRGSQLSGGQKQRIAIARAIVKNPKILLLDEATSALDNESEAIVQAALDRVSQGRTTIIVAHRLSTILNADIILAFKNGKVAESGTHSELMELKGVYYNQVIKQQLGITTKKSLKVVEQEEAGQLTENIHADVVPVEEESQKDGKKDKKNKKSKKDKKDSKKDKKEKKEKEKKPDMKRVFKMNSPEWFYIVVGCFASILSGAVQPAFSIILSKAVGIFSECSYDERKSKIELYCILFVVIGVVTFISNIIQSGFFAFSGENLTKRIRSKAFQQMLTQEIGWFDKKENNVGTLCTKLSVEASAVQGTTGVRLGFFLMNMGNLGVGLIISFVFSWAITLLILAFMPFMIVSGVLQTKMLTGFGSKDKEIIEATGKLTNEAIGNIRTVTSLGKQSYFTDRYSEMIYKPLKGALKSAHINGIMLGFTTSILYYAIAAAYTFGAFLVQNNLFGMNLERIMLVFGCIMFGAQAVGQAASLMPDYAKAQAATVSIFELLDRKTSIDNWSNDTEQTPPSLDQSNVNLEAVEFTYPSRLNSKILNNLCISIAHGQRVALVGSSGCGKSTIAQLLERFYDPDQGQVTLNGQDIRKVSLYWLRSQIGIVSQEPILFDMSIAENIAYGDNSRQVTRDEIIEAAKKANIHDFIEKKLPKSYETNVGSRGVQLSGGQKQRVAIARALIRNPKILILDEATSALDPTSEAIVQEALDRAQLGRTCIVIAHRLSTIRTADRIFVMQNGVVTESGTHDELLALKDGFYARLNGVM